MGSVDRTVRFWNLETFDLIGSSGPEECECIYLAFKLKKVKDQKVYYLQEQLLKKKEMEA